MYESIYKNNELENEVSSDMSYFWYSDDDGCTFWDQYTIERLVSRSEFRRFHTDCMVLSAST